MITFKEIEERIERGDTPEIIREFLEEAARSGEMFHSELVRFICTGFGGEVFIVRKPQIKQSATVFVALHL